MRVQQSTNNSGRVMRNTEGRYKISRLSKNIEAKQTLDKMQTVHKGTLSSRDAFGYTRSQKTPLLTSDFQTSDSKTYMTEVAFSRFTFSVSFLFPFPLFLTSYLQKTGEWWLSCLLIIRPQARQITQLQSCAFLHGVDWLWSILNEGLCRLKRGWSCH
ncbi:hypothetical protein AVEN_72794-1 [Araneus ventricosus]|uniref:Uncharacterized protein n=1 Tax=Araneus ventricosus TaxID=182803 RepID=A0A4Y2LNF5_ARAVE|nr:hypothetical protein AVEN_72794-1 [Araneus ventricosus]